MASTYTNLLRLEKMGKGDQNGTWGSTTNNQYELLEDAISGAAVVTHTDAATYTLTSLNGVTDEARMAILRIEGTLTAARALVVPTNTKLYAIYNATVGGFAINVRTAAGTAVSVPNGGAVQVAIGTDGNAFLVGGLDINSLAAKATPIDADAVPIMDSAAGNATRKLTFANLRTWIASFFVPRSDTIANNTDLNTIITSGFRKLNATHANMPSGYAQGQLITSKSGDTIAQIIVSPSARRMAWRGTTLTSSDTVWTDAVWTEAAHAASVSTAAPSGGVDGDVHYQYTA